ncbi:hypothetical protein HHB90_11030 [Neisseria meningitidis]|nr:hypothetical protein [Neisseria meningitidis]
MNNPISVTVEGYWQFDLGGFAVKGQSISGSSGTAIADTGTSLIVGPTSVVDAFLESTDATVDDGLGVVDCSTYTTTLPDITFTIDDNEYTLTPEDYVLNIEDECFIGIEGSDDLGIDWILGDVFIGAHYTVFNMGEKTVTFGTLT